MQLVLADPLSEPEDVPLRSKPSSIPPQFASIDDYLAHLRGKYKLKLITRPRIVTPISKDPPSPTPSSAPTPASSTSNPTLGSAYIRGRIKRTARKRAPPSPRASVLNVSEDESVPHQEEEQAGSFSHTPSIFGHAQKAA